MPSSYSPNLRIELIAQGEQAGTWGTTTNNNLGTLVEDAISGYAVVSVSTANQALTALNGAADQSRNAMLALTTSTTDNFAVYAPPESKQYTIKNASAYTATIYNSTSLGNTTAAGTGVPIPAGKTVTVWSDGDNFALQNDLFVGDVVGDVVGEITAADGSTAVTQATSDNSTKLANTAFVQAIKQSLHPVGSIYINASNNTNPATLLGFGTWTAFGAGRVPVGFDATDPLFDTAEETGGSKDAIVVSHTHTAQSAGSHRHDWNATAQYSTDDTPPNDPVNRLGGAPATSGQPAASSGAGLNSQNYLNLSGTHTHTIESTGASGTNANIQPYITVYMWKRTA